MRRTSLPTTLGIPLAVALAATACAGNEAPPAAATPSAVGSSAAPAASAAPSAGALESLASASGTAGGPTGTTPSGTASGPTGTPGTTGTDTATPITALPAGALVARARQAASTSTSVRLRGQVSDSGRAAELDLRLAGGGCAGTIGNGSISVRLVLAGQDLYLQGDEGFWRATSPQLAQLVGTKWVKTPSATPQFAALVQFCDKNKLFERLLNDRLTVRKGEQRTIDGQRTVTLTGREGGSLSVATEGEPYPVRIEPGQGQRGAGRVDFSDWNRDVDLTIPPPSEVIDVGALRPTSAPSPAGSAG